MPDDGPPAGDELPLAVQPRDRDELVDWVDRVLTPVFGHPPRHDEDDDIPVNAGTAALFVRVRDDMPAVQIFCRLVGGVRDPEAAVHEVNLLNAEHRFVDFALVDDAVMADVHVLAMPLAPAHLRDMLEVMCGVADRVGPVLARRVGGEVAFTARTTADEEDPLDDLLVEHEATTARTGTRPSPPIESLPVPPAMEVLRHLEIDRPGSVTAEVAATVCDWDRDTLLGCWTGTTPRSAAGVTRSRSPVGRTTRTRPMSARCSGARRRRPFACSAGHCASRSTASCGTAAPPSVATDVAISASRGGLVAGTCRCPGSTGWPTTIRRCSTTVPPGGRSAGPTSPTGRRVDSPAGRLVDAAPARP